MIADEISARSQDVIEDDVDPLALTSASIESSLDSETVIWQAILDIAKSAVEEFGVPKKFEEGIRRAAKRIIRRTL